MQQPPGAEPATQVPLTSPLSSSPGRARSHPTLSKLRGEDARTALRQKGLSAMGHCTATSGKGGVGDQTGGGGRGS